LVRKIVDLSPYLVNGEPDEDRMLWVDAFLGMGAIDLEPDDSSFLDSGAEVIRY
jgi:hypothetical protein